MYTKQTQTNKINDRRKKQKSLDTRTTTQAVQANKREGITSKEADIITD
jgi:hypothetical protein